MLEAIISSKTRVKLLVKFFLNPESSAYLRSLESEFGESTNAIRVELNKFEAAGMLESKTVGNRKVFTSKKSFPLFNELRNIVLKYTGVDSIIDQITKKLGEVNRIYLTGDLAKGLDSKIIDLVLIGKPDKNYLLNLIGKAEKQINRKIRFLIYTESEEAQIEMDPARYMLLWSNTRALEKGDKG